MEIQNLIFLYLYAMNKAQKMDKAEKTEKSTIGK